MCLRVCCYCLWVPRPPPPPPYTHFNLHAPSIHVYENNANDKSFLYTIIKYNLDFFFSIIFLSYWIFLCVVYGSSMIHYLDYDFDVQLLKRIFMYKFSNQWYTHCVVWTCSFGVSDWLYFHFCLVHERNRKPPCKIVYIRLNKLHSLSPQAFSGLFNNRRCTGELIIIIIVIIIA